MNRLLLCLLLTACAHQPSRVAPGVSTAGLSRSLTSAQGSIAGAKASAGNAASRVDAVRGIAARVDSKATVVLEYLNGK